MRFALRLTLFLEVIVVKIYNHGDRVHVRHKTENGLFDYDARVQYRNTGIIGPGAPYYTVTGCTYPLPSTSLSDPQSTEV